MQNVEAAFADVHRKYERTKQVFDIISSLSIFCFWTLGGGRFQEEWRTAEALCCGVQDQAEESGSGHWLSSTLVTVFQQFSNRHFHRIFRNPHETFSGMICWKPTLRKNLRRQTRRLTTSPEARSELKFVEGIEYFFAFHRTQRLRNWRPCWRRQRWKQPVWRGR